MSEKATVVITHICYTDIFQLNTVWFGQKGYNSMDGLLNSDKMASCFKIRTF